MVPCSDINENFETPDTMQACTAERDQPWTSGISWSLGGHKSSSFALSKEHLSSFCVLLRRFKPFDWYLILLHLQEAWLMGYIALMIDKDTHRIAPQAAGGLWGGHSGSWMCRTLSCLLVPHQGCLWPCCPAPLHASQEEWTPRQDYTRRTSGLYYPKPQNFMFVCLCFNLTYAISILKEFYYVTDIL